jgi:hypothetical protein
MRKLEDFDEKFALNESSMKNVIGSKEAPTTSEGPLNSTCENDCGDTTKNVYNDNGVFLKTVNTIYDVDC